MATLKEHIYAITNPYTKGPASDDFWLSKRNVAHYLKVNRSVLLKRKLDKESAIAEQNYQTFCMTLSLSDYYDCSCIPADLQCKILKSSKKLPMEIVEKAGSTLQIKTLDGRTLDKGSIKELAYSEYSLANDGVIKWFIEDSYLFVYNTTSLTTIVVKGIFEDPEKLANYTSCSSSSGPCYDAESSEFPIDSDLVLPMYDMTWAILDRMTQRRADTTNDSQDNVQ